MTDKISSQNIEAEKPNDFYNRLAQGYTFASMFSNFAGSVADYGRSNVNSSFLKVQASAVELQAEQRANQLRQSLIAGMGSVMYSAARRGVKVSSANVSSNLLRSSENVGLDNQMMFKNASIQAQGLRSQAKVNQIAGKYQMISSGLNTLSSLFALGSAYKGEGNNGE